MVGITANGTVLFVTKSRIRYSSQKEGFAPSAEIAAFMCDCIQCAHSSAKYQLAAATAGT
jgi:hypothetical protein